MQPQFLHDLVVIRTHGTELCMKIRQFGVIVHQRLVHLQHLERLPEEVRFEENRPCLDTRFSEHGEETVVLDVYKRQRMGTSRGLATPLYIGIAYKQTY